MAERELHLWSTVAPMSNGEEEQEETGREQGKDIGENSAEIISKLPKEKGWLTEHLYQYENFWYHPSYGLEGIMSIQQHFKPRSDDILLITSPKCGTTWLKALIFTIMNRTRYDFSAHPLLHSSPHDCVPFLELNLFRFNPIVDLECLPSPRLFASHIPFTSLPKSVLTSTCRIVYTCRNPNDVLVSLWHFMTKLRDKELQPFSLQEAFDLFSKGVSPFGPFWDHVLGYWKASQKFPNQMLFLKYEDLKNEPFVYVKRLAEFLGKPFSIEEEGQGMVHETLKLCSFENMSNLEVNKNGTYRAGVKNNVFYRQGKVGDWKNHLTREMIEKLDSLITEKFDGSGIFFKISPN
ncbi:Sulfotransferase domain [Dillenia turbinata]|uniref:Sulfotransferase n=1 Tax=Dillenia turbinata TaxID=194707 RepID=A0AAN8Z530_9MAGN